MAELKQLDSSKIAEEQAINLISKHFLIAIQVYIQTTNEKKFLNVWEKLGEVKNNDIPTSTDKTTSNETYEKNTHRYNNNGYNNQRYQPRPNYNSTPPGNRQSSLFINKLSDNQIIRQILIDDTENASNIEIEEENKNINETELKIKQNDM